MKKLISLIVIGLLTRSTAIFSQGNWELVIPQPTSNQMVSLDFADEKTGLSVGEYGSILKTTDGGFNWRIIEIPWMYDLSDVCFVTAKIAFVTGTDGLILKSIDGGETWAPKENEYTNNLNRILFRNENQGWAIGEKGLILHSDDGGETWNQQMTNCGENLLGIEIISESGICVVGTNKFILLTQNKGAVWDSVNFEPMYDFYTYHFKDVYFMDSLHGWICGGEAEKRGIVLRTQDGGHSWQEMRVNEFTILELNGGFLTHGGGYGTSLNQIYFSEDLQTGLCLAYNNNLVYHTTDGGKIWTAKFNNEGGESFCKKSRFNFLNESRLIKTGFCGDFQFSDDGGESWYYLNEINRNWEYFIPGKNGKFLVQRAWSDYRTTPATYVYQNLRSHDLGDSIWEYNFQIFDTIGVQIDNPGGYLHKPFYLNGKDTLWTEKGSALVYSTDFGLNWYPGETQYRGSKYHVTKDTVFTYHLLVPQLPYDSFELSLRFRYSFDGGNTLHDNLFSNIWNDIPSAADDLHNLSAINAHCFINGQIGFLVGTDGNILKTTDTGENWENINSGVVEDLWDIEFINSKVGFAVGDFGRILKTEDCGETWRKTDSGTQQDIYSIGFRNEKEGWAGTEKGLQYTTDGGETWYGVPVRYQHGLIRQIEFDKRGNGYAFTLPSHKFPYEVIYPNRPSSYVFLLRMKNEISDIAAESDLNAMPKEFILNQNYPNPFNATTRIEYSLPTASEISLKIFNIRGQLVCTLKEDAQPTGQHSVIWNGLSDDGKPVASGIYVYQLTSGEIVKTRKLLLLK